MRGKALPLDVQRDLSLPMPIFSQEEVQALEHRIKEIGLLLKEEKKAKFKLEIVFNHERSRDRAFPGVLTFWENANKLHGGGDSKVYGCPAKDVGKADCEAIIPDAANSGMFLTCVKCGHIWRRDDVFGEVFYRATYQGWTDILMHWFKRLELDADIRIKYAKDDIRAVTAKEQERQRGGELLEKARSEDRRATAIYRLASIIKDTSSGADLRGCILNFLRA